METKNTLIILSLTLIFLISINFASAIIVDANYITIYPGEVGEVTLDIDNSENFDIEDVTAQIYLISTLPDGTSKGLPFSIIGSSEKDVDDLDEGDDDSVSFTLKAFTDITPGDYQIPYEIRYVNVKDEEEEGKKGTFGIRVSAKTELDFSVEAEGETGNVAIIGNEGRISLEIINEGLGEIKSASVEIAPQGFELLSKNKIFVGTINSEDTDIATFDVIFKEKNPVLNAVITYKDFENKEKKETIVLPFKVYTQDQALELGLISKSKTGIYFIVVIVLIIVWLVYRKIKKAKRKKK